jgi:hypothetical protein
MSPLAVLTGIIMGSAVTITIGLAMVMVVFLTLSGDQPGLAREYGTLLKSFGLFVWAVDRGELRLPRDAARPALAVGRASGRLARDGVIGWYYWPR